MAWSWPATGFLAPHKWLVTNWHVLSGRDAETEDILSSSGATPDSIRIRFHGTTLTEFSEQVVPLRDEDGTPLWYEHPIHGHHVDVAALRLPDNVGQVITEVADVGTTYSTPIRFSSYDPEDANPAGIYISVTERLSIIGFPTGEDVQGFPIWTQGFVASEPDLSFRNLPCFLIDSRTRKGQSGSPLSTTLRAASTRQHQALRRSAPSGQHASWASTLAVSTRKATSVECGLLTP